jgi:hypothetical protein
MPAITKQRIRAQALRLKRPKAQMRVGRLKTITAIPITPNPSPKYHHGGSEKKSMLVVECLDPDLSKRPNTIPRPVIPSPQVNLSKPKTKLPIANAVTAPLLGRELASQKSSCGNARSGLKGPSEEQ